MKIFLYIKNYENLCRKKCNMQNLSVIILTYNEEKHIARCIDNVKRIAK